MTQEQARPHKLETCYRGRSGDPVSRRAKDIVCEDWEPPKQDLGVWISWRVFALSRCLHGAADQGQTAKEIAVEYEAKCEEGEDKQDFLKIVEALEDPLESASSAVRGVGTFAPWTVNW